MPRKKKTIVEETLPDENQLGNDTDIVDIVCTLTKVYKLNGATRSFCFQSSEPVDEVLIQNMYPTGGKFIAIEYNAMNEVLRTNNIDIEAKPLTSLPPAVNGGGDISLLREELNYSRNMIMQLLTGLFQSRQNTDSPSMLEMVQVMQGLQNLGPKTSPVDLVIKGMELGAKANGNGGSSDWKTELMQTAKEVLPPLVQTMAEARKPQGTTTRMIQPTSTPADFLKQGIAWIKSQILTGLQPDLAVGMLIRFANDPQYQPILSTAIQGNIDTFITIDPEIANEPFRSWFTVAIEELKGWYAEQSATDTDNDGGTGNDSDVAGDAVISAGRAKITKIS